MDNRNNQNTHCFSNNNNGTYLAHNNLEAKENIVASYHAFAILWIPNTGALHHITTEPHKMLEYNGFEEVALGDGNKIPITHNGLTQLYASNTTYELSNILCA